MNLLLDTHLLLWLMEDKSLLPKASLLYLEAAGNSFVFSVVNVWEVAIKSSARRSDFYIDPTRFRDGLFDSGFTELQVTGEHAIAVGTLPLIHKDPFDRLLVAQAMVENMLLLTADPAIARYPGPIRLV